MSKQNENDPGFPRTLSVSFDIVTEAPKDHFEECLVDALSYLIDMIDPDHVIALDDGTLQIERPDRKRGLEIKRHKREALAESNLSIANGIRLLNEGYNLGSAIDCTRRDILNEDGFPTMPHAKLREALINSVDLLNATGANEIKRILGFQKRSMAFKIED